MGFFPAESKDAIPDFHAKWPVKKCASKQANALARSTTQFKEHRGNAVVLKAGYLGQFVLFEVEGVAQNARIV